LPGIIDFVYINMGTVNPCTQSPCKNNGICNVVQDQAVCSCINGWTGDYCDGMNYSRVYIRLYNFVQTNCF